MGSQSGVVPGYLIGVLALLRFVPCYPEVVSGYLGSVPGTWATRLAGMVIRAVWVVWVVGLVMVVAVVRVIEVFRMVEVVRKLNVPRTARIG